MPDDASYQRLKSAIEVFSKKHEDHPLIKDSIGQLKAALYDIEPVFMSPGQRAAREAYPQGLRAQKEIYPSGQEPMGNSPKHQ